MNKTIAQILREAKYLLLTYGWTQGSMAATEPHIRQDIGENATATAYLAPSRVPYDAPEAACFCGMGAVAKIVGGTFSEDRALAALRMAVAKRTGEPWDNNKSDCGWIPHYNDTIGRTKEEMLSLFDEAIELADRV